MRTLDYYEKNAKRFAEGTVAVDFTATQNRFLDKLQPGGGGFLISAAGPAVTPDIFWNRVIGWRLWMAPQSCADWPGSIRESG